MVRRLKDNRKYVNHYVESVILQVKYKISSVGMVEDPVIGPHSLPSVNGGDGLNGGGSFPGDSIPGGWAGGGTFPGGGGTGGGGIPFPNDTIQYVSSVTEDMEDMANTRLRLDYVGNRVYRNGTLERLGFVNGYIDGDGTYCYCLRDWQGNNRVVLAGNDSIIESDNYYPYGQHFTEGAQAAYSAQRWKFGDKEFDAEKGLNWHDFGARFLMPQFGLFTTQDPLRHRNWHLSPYLYCAANPIRFIDPTGMDEWEIDKYGYITNHVQTKEHDAFKIYQNDGILNEITFPYGTSSQLLLNHDFSSFSFSSELDGRKLFEFLAQNTIVEWGFIYYNLFDFPFSIVTTSHGEKSNEAIGSFIKYMYDQTSSSKSLIEVTHNHPDNNYMPSGLDGSPGDISASQWIENFTKSFPKFGIYTTSRKYNYYHSKDKAPKDKDGNEVVGGTDLDELIVVPNIKIKL